MLRIAVPNKGTLSTPAAAMLREAGYRQRTDPKDLICRDEPHNVEFFYLRPRDIALERVKAVVRQAHIAIQQAVRHRGERVAPPCDEAVAIASRGVEGVSNEVYGRRRCRHPPW